jgi:hypothetical protein
LKDFLFMTGILDQIALSSSRAQGTQFRPTTADEFFALRLAQKLHEASAAQHYADLFERYSQAQLLIAFRRAQATGSHLDPARSFHVELGRLTGRNGNGACTRQLAAIRIERRAVAVVILSGEHLQYAPLVRQLSSDSDKAIGSAAAFISRILAKCPFETAALETLPEGAEVQRSALMKTIHRVLSEQAVGIWQTSKQDILAAFGHPPMRFRNQVREVVSSIWPVINGGFGSPLIKDALALGLYCQTEYLFNL